AHYKAFEPLVEQYEKDHGVDVNLNVVVPRAMNVRLASLLMTDPASPDLPDLVEIEIGYIGRYFRAPLEDVGFIPLNGYLKESGWYDKIVEQRYAPWSKGGLIFGVPHDIHPVTITYRQDLFEEAGIADLSQMTTWPAFHGACLRFRDYWKDKVRYRHAIELPEAAIDYLMVMLQQRGINLVDDQNRLYFTDPKVADTMAFYAEMVTGPRKVGAQSTGGAGALAKDVGDGNICAFITADWRVTQIKRFSQHLAGRMRMMPLPVFDPGDKRTATWGGTMIGITKGCENPKEAWRMIEKLYFSKEGLASRRKFSDVLPPVISLWDDPVYHQPDPYFGGQKADELFIELAREIPIRYVTPTTGLAQTQLNAVLAKATDYIRERGNADGLEAAIMPWLVEGERDLKARIDQMRFDE
ncbi:MAG: extracellular solute-binding protein, partial [Planctomycetota bacterium]|nr:extracellular solute-binding protein [Planctomycetota bacterium]